MIANLLWMSGITIALVAAGVGYASGRPIGKGVFVVGVITAVLVLVLAATACSALPDSAKSDRQLAEEAVACLGSGYGETTVVSAMQIYDREQLISYRDSNCEESDDSQTAKDDSATGSGLGGLFSFTGTRCIGCSNIQEMLDEYEANPLRAERRYRGRTMVVGGKIEAIRDNWAVPPQPEVRLKSEVSLTFVSRARGWVSEKSVGDTIEAQCLVDGFLRFSLGGRDGVPILEDCEPPEEN